MAAARRISPERTPPFPTEQMTILGEFLPKLFLFLLWRADPTLQYAGCANQSLHIYLSLRLFYD
jgi:hypothetical protein